VLDLVAASPAGQSLTGHSLGISAFEALAASSYVVDISMKDKAVTIHKVVTASTAGSDSPDNIQAQLEEAWSTGSRRAAWRDHAGERRSKAG